MDVLLNFVGEDRDPNESLRQLDNCSKETEDWLWGAVNVGAFDVTAHCVNEIREAAFDKCS